MDTLPVARLRCSRLLVGKHTQRMNSHNTHTHTRTQVWVLTGDKVETAINISLACGLFSGSMSLVEMRDRDFERAATPEAEAEVGGCTGSSGAVHTWGPCAV